MVAAIQRKNRMERLHLLLVLAGIVLILVLILIFSVYSLQSLHFIGIRIDSIGSMFAFIGLIMLGTGFLGIIGSLLERLREYVCGEQFHLASTIVQELLLIAIFGTFVHTVDLWISGIEIGNALTEISVALFLYGILTLLGKLGEEVRTRDAEAREKLDR